MITNDLLDDVASSYQTISSNLVPNLCPECKLIIVAALHFDYPFFTTHHVRYR